jgi:predicted nucleotidyltransferase
MFLEGGAIEDKNKNIFYIIFYNEKNDEIYVKPKYIYKNSKYYKITEDKNLNLLQRYLNYNIYNYSDYLKKYTYIFHIENINKYYNPVARLLQILENPLNAHEKAAKEIVLNIIKESNEEIQNFGISGSLLLNFQNEKSDIDIFYYGNNYKKVYEALSKLFKKRKFLPIKGNLLRNLYIERGFRNVIDYKIFKRIEKLKRTEGIYGKKFLFSIKLVKSRHFKIIERKDTIEDEIKAIDTKEAYLWPAKYVVKSLINDDTYSIITYRQRYTEILKEGDTAKIKGEIEITNEGKIINIDEKGYIVPL